MMLNWSGFMAVAQLPPSTIIGKTRCTRIPRGAGAAGVTPSLNVYWVLAICAGSRQPELAWQFMRETAGPAMDKVTSLAGGTGCGFRPGTTPRFARSSSTTKSWRRYIRAAIRMPGIPEYPAINEVLSRMTAGAVAGRKSVERALSDAAQECATILRLM